jgi:hypothetical protein
VILMCLLDESSTVAEFSRLRRSVLTFDVVPGLVAQGESVRLTRGRSLVRSQSGPPSNSQFKPVSLEIWL